MVRTLCFFSALLAIAFGCSCIPSTDKEIFCRSTFVGHFKVLNRTSTPEKLSLIYTAEVIEVFKDQNGSPQKGSIVSISTGSNSAMCGVDWLSLGNDYLLSGFHSKNALSINYCSIFRPYVWSQVTQEVKDALQHGSYEPCPQH
ncbi:hypothetical protein QR680_005338 [Steinernema hermaphroditum]|uniref:NTR domain-containing protein n=1 Tax=Steinernema hermaphroditum TaxID=289476 RepID=A0AA39HTY6_9BILA|nr:hypothetical protein QR680_005338 [Steinernema hermaphroditum]